MVLGVDSVYPINSLSPLARTCCWFYDQITMSLSWSILRLPVGYSVVWLRLIEKLLQGCWKVELLCAGGSSSDNKLITGAISVA